MNQALIILVLVGMYLLLFADSARGDGMELEGLGARAISMGGAFIGLADDSSAIYWNPAGLAWLKGSRVDFGVYSMSSYLVDRTSMSNVPLDEMHPSKGDSFVKIYPSEPDRFDDEHEIWPSVATIPNIIGYKNYGDYTIAGGLYANLGSYSDWDDEMEDPVTSADIIGSHYSMIMILNGNLSVGKKISDRLSFGLGVDLIYVSSKVDINKDYRNSLLPVSPDYEFRLESNADGFGFQAILGGLYKISPKLSIGAVFKTGSEFDLKGKTRIRQSFFPENGTIDLIEKSDHTHRFVYPMAWGVGLAYRPINRLTLTFDWEMKDWTKFRWPQADIDYRNEGLLLQDIHEDPDWRSANSYHFGAEYHYNERLALRGGFFFEESGIPSDGEGFSTVFAGYQKFTNIGLGYRWNVWNLDLEAGRMWGRTPEDTGHT